MDEDARMCAMTRVRASFLFFIDSIIPAISAMERSSSMMWKTRSRCAPAKKATMRCRMSSDAEAVNRHRYSGMPQGTPDRSASAACGTPGDSRNTRPERDQGRAQRSTRQRESPENAMFSGLGAAERSKSEPVFLSDSAVLRSSKVTVSVPSL